MFAARHCIVEAQPGCNTVLLLCLIDCRIKGRRTAMSGLEAAMAGQTNWAGAGNVLRRRLSVQR